MRQPFPNLAKRPSATDKRPLIRMKRLLTTRERLPTLRQAFPNLAKRPSATDEGLVVEMKRLPAMRKRLPTLTKALPNATTRPSAGRTRGILAPGPVRSKLPIPLLARAARLAPAASAPVDPAGPLSILSLTAASYGARPSDDVVTIPTGFDPVAVTLFETIVEGAYLVANADGLFDDEERRTFERIVVEACGGAVASQQIGALVVDLRKQLHEQGVDRRIQSLAASVSKKEHAQEVLRVGALMAQASDGASAVERGVLTKIATACGLDAGAVDAAMADAQSALGTAAAG